MHGIFRREKELRFGRSRYPISSTDSHITIMLYSHCRVKYIVRLNWTRRNVLYAFTNRYALKRHVRVDDSRAEITHSAVGYDKDGNPYYIRSVLEVPNGMKRATPQPWACAEILRSANVSSLRALWKSRLGCDAATRLN